MTSQITTTQVAEFFANVLETKTVDFINKKANKIYCASYRSGAYGRIFSKFITDNFTTKLNLNGGSTSIALEITRLLESKGYKFVNQNQNVIFVKN